VTHDLLNEADELFPDVVLPFHYLNALLTHAVRVRPSAVRREFHFTGNETALNVIVRRGVNHSGYAQSDTFGVLAFLPVDA
jgi:hypothetical protein